MNQPGCMPVTIYNQRFSTPIDWIIPPRSETRLLVFSHFAFDACGHLANGAGNDHLLLMFRGMSHQKLNQLLRCQIDDLKALTAATDASVRFILDEVSFSGEELDNRTDAQERLIIGRIFPKCDPLKEGAFQIETRLLPIRPFSPPKVRFLTPIYHPNVREDGKTALQSCLIQPCAPFRCIYPSVIAANCSMVEHHVDRRYRHGCCRSNR